MKWQQKKIKVQRKPFQNLILMILTSLLIALTACQSEQIIPSFCPPYLSFSKEFVALVATGQYKEAVKNDFNRILKQQEDILKNCYPDKYEIYLKNKAEAERKRDAQVR